MKAAVGPASGGRYAPGPGFSSPDPGHRRAEFGPAHPSQRSYRNPLDLPCHNARTEPDKGTCT